MMGAGLSAELTSINPQRTAALRPSCGNVHGAASVTIGPNRTLMRGAANGGFEPRVTDAAHCANGSEAPQAAIVSGLAIAARPLRTLCVRLPTKPPLVLHLDDQDATA
jgi:hypothetical protein